MKRVLVTGANGFIGRHASIALHRKGWKVVTMTRTSQRVAAPEGGNFFENVAIDMSQRDCWRPLAGVTRCDAIVHLAARVVFDVSSGKSLLGPNVSAVAELVPWADAWSAKLVFASTAIVCGTRTERIDGRSPVRPDNDYARSKWIGEQILNLAEVDSAIMRFGGVFGIEGPTHLGLNRALAQTLAGEPPRVVGMGNAARNYIYVRDAAAAIAHTLEYDLRGTHLIAGSDVTAIGEMLSSICKVLLPGKSLVRVEGAEARDQLIESSPDFPPARSFIDALLDIKQSARQ